MVQPIKVKIKVSDPEKLRALSTLEFQKGTFFVASPQKFPTGTPIEIALLLPDKTTTVPITGVVEPSDRPGFLVRLADAAGVSHTVDAYLRTTDTVERREVARVAAAVKIRLKFADAAQFEETYTKEVSLGGLFVATPNPVPVGTDVEIVFLVAGTPFTVTGKVAHHQPRSGAPGMGIRLAPLSIDVRAQFESLVQSAALSATNDQRRQAPRVATRASIKLRPTTHRRFEEMCLKDISRGGTFVAATKCYPIGTPLTIVLVHPTTGKEVRVDAQVVRDVSVDEARVTGTEAGMGIRFDPLTPEARATIDELIANALEGDGSVATAQVSGPPKENIAVGDSIVRMGAEPPPLRAETSGVGPSPVTGSPDRRTPSPLAPPPKRGAERRMAPRIESRTRVMLSFGDADELREMYTRDISKGGAFIVTDDPAPAMTQIELTIVPPGAAGISLMADVVHSVPKSAVTNPKDTPGMGVRFRNLTPEKRAILEDYLRGLAEVTPTPGGSPTAPGITLGAVTAATEAAVGGVVTRGTGNDAGAAKSPQQKRAEEFYALAKECLARGDRETALRNIQLATTFDPTEERFRALLKEIRNR